MNFIKNFKNALKDKEFKRKVVLVLIPILIYLAGGLITLPNVDVDKVMSSDLSQLGAFGVLRMMTGGQLKTFSLFALGVSPAITASIVLHLLSVEAFPALRELQTGGKEDKRKFELINVATLLALSFLQGYATIVMFDRTYGILKNNNFVGVMTTLVVMVAGVMILYGLGKWLEKNDIQGGLTVFIATGILSALPSSIMHTLSVFKLIGGVWRWVLTALYIAAYIAIITFIIWFTGKVVKMPVVSGRSVAGDSRNIKRAERKTFIPIAYNPAGVMPIIVASSLMTAPLIIASWFAPTSRVYKLFSSTLSLGTYLGIFVFGLLVIFAAYTYNQIQINPEMVADDFKKNGTYIMGVRPGKDTANAIRQEVFSISKYSAGFLVIVGVLPMLLPLLTKGVIPTDQAFGGTGLIILVDVFRDIYRTTEVVGKQAKYKRRSSLWV